MVITYTSSSLLQSGQMHSDVKSEMLQYALAAIY